MKILYVASEVVPFAKSGGLADVAGALPVELAKLGHDVRVVMPHYGVIDDEAYNLLPILGDIVVNLGNTSRIAQIKRTMFPDTDVPVYFVQNSELFEREGLYGENGVDYDDNATRFAFFCKAAIWLLKGLDWIPDIIHCNDWQTALIPAYVKTESDMRFDEALGHVRILYTIHNLAYQGLFPAEDAAAIGIGPELFHPAALEFYGLMNFMKGGILFSDKISTVSPRYAREIQTKEFGCGLEGVLELREEHISGIMNGIDISVWNPAHDALIPQTYSAKNLTAKAKCKAALQREMGLPLDGNIPIIGMISRLDPQKGFDILEEVADEIFLQDLQFVLLGSGAQEYQRMFEKLAAKHPKQIGIALRYDDALAHLIEAGSDMFLMPSRYEPCGLNQLYSLRYGTIPIVRGTGGLADSITDSNPETVSLGKATGFVFEEYSGKALLEGVKRALVSYRHKAEWAALIQNAMACDHSWPVSARAYDELYSRMVH